MINRTGFLLLALGALLFAGVFYLASSQQMLGWSDETSTDPRLLISLYTIAFGLPYALWELTRRTNWLVIPFLIVLVPLAHYAAMTAGFALIGEMQELSSPFLTGAAAGFVGAALSFLALYLLGLRAPGAGPMTFGAGLVLLTAWGGVAMKLIPEQPERVLDVILPVYLPWQIIFAFFLAALLRPSPPRGATA